MHNTLMHHSSNGIPALEDDKRDGLFLLLRHISVGHAHSGFACSQIDSILQIAALKSSILIIVLVLAPAAHQLEILPRGLHLCFLLAFFEHLSRLPQEAVLQADVPHSQTSLLDRRSVDLRVPMRIIWPTLPHWLMMQDRIIAVIRRWRLLPLLDVLDLLAFAITFMKRLLELAGEPEQAALLIQATY